MKDRTITWCLKQKRGIRIIEPNENLTKAYLKKATSALNTMNAASDIGEPDWTTTTAYYARYFALYALLMKIGVKSEIHDCTIALARLLSEKRILEKTLVTDISNSKQARIDIQYYVEREIDKERIKRDTEKARSFVLTVEKIIEDIETDKINAVRNHLKSVIYTHRS